MIAGVAPPSTAGVVLSGGGAYAAYEVGVVRALVSGASPATGFIPVDAQIVTGTSAGSVNAAILASASTGDPIRPVDHLERVWLNEFADRPGACTGSVLRLRVNPLSLVNPACTASPQFYASLADDVAYLAQESFARATMLVTSDRTLRQRLVEAFDLGTLISGDPLRQLLAEVIDFAAIRASRCALRIATTNWRTGAVRVFENVDMTDAAGVNVLMASSAIPGVFRSVEIDGEPYVDGGVVMNTPLRPAIQAGASELHVVYLDPDVRRIPLPRLRNTLNTLYRMLAISFGLTVTRDIRTAAAINRRLRERPDTARTSVVTDTPRPQPYRPLTIHRYNPDVDLGGTFRWLDFDRDLLARLIDRGYEDACRHDCRASGCVIADEDICAAPADDRRTANRHA